MSKLMEIGKRKHKITVDGKAMEIVGMSADIIVQLCERFPAFATLINRQVPTAEDIIKGGPRQVGAIIAAAFGTFGDEAEENHAATLDLEIQLGLLLDIYDATFPGGVRPFVQRVENKFGIKLQAEVLDQPSSEASAENSKSNSPARPNGPAPAEPLSLQRAADA